MCDAVVLGAGVIGLSAALELHNAGYKVAIVARDLPEDSDSVGFCSPWAGCNFCPFDASGSTPASQRERRTFPRLAKLAKDQPELCEKIQFYQVWDGEGAAERAWYADMTEPYRSLDADKDKIHGNKRFGCTYQSFIIHAPRYMAHLADQLRRANVPIIRKRLSSLWEAYDLPETGPVDLVINASGLGAKSLIGIEDDTVFPARGQTVLVKAPGVKTCVMHTEGFYVPTDGTGNSLPEPAYIIPRPGPQGYVVLGGTYIPQNYSTLPDLKTAERILQDCYNLLPELAGPNGTSWKDIEVVGHNVGLRPAREGGARIELEKKVLKGAALNPGKRDDGREGRDVAVVHAYGFGGAGYQQSLGAAEQVLDIVRAHLGEPSRS